jgi:hypothetical protein
MTLGVGGAGLVLGTILGVVATADKSSISSACGPSKVCPPSEQGALSSAKTVANLSTVSFVVGGVGVVLGGTLILTDNFRHWSFRSGGGDAPPPSAARATIQPFVTADPSGPLGAGGGLRGTF